MAARKKRPMRTCDAPGFDVPVRRGILMCRPHWFQVPKPLRDAISQTYHRGSIVIKGVAKALIIIAALLAIPFIIAAALTSAKGEKR